MGMEAPELARWTRFAAKGGIGKCIATCDCVAESADDLMFLKDDEITVLLQLPDREGFYLGYCEGVVGRFAGQDVQFTTKLKKPVMTKRSSSMGTVTGNTSTNISPSPTVSGSGASPSPTPHTSISYNPQHGVTHRTSSTPSPSAFRSVSVSSLNSQTRAESLERSSERRTSGISARHPASPLSTARALALENEQEEKRDVGEEEHVPNAFATLHEVALAEAAASGSGAQPRHASIGSRESQYTASPFGTPSPREAQLSRVDTRSSDRDDSRAGTRTSSPRQGLDGRRPVSTERWPAQVLIPSSSSQQLSTSTSATSTSFSFSTAASSSSSSPQTSPPSSPPRPLHTQPPSLQQHRYTAHAPSPLTLHPGQPGSPPTTISPLRITKRSPGPSPGLGFARDSNSNVQQIPRSPPPVGALPLPPAAMAPTHSMNTSISVSQTLTAPARSHAQGLSPSSTALSTGPGLSPSNTAFSPLSSPSVYSSPPQSAAPTLGSYSSSPSHTATFADRLGLNSGYRSPSVVDDRYEGDTVGSSPATLAHEGRELDTGASSSQNRAQEKPQAQPAQELSDTSAAAAGVSIGLSLLEGLIGTYSDDEDSDDDDVGSQYSDQGDTTTTRRDNRISTVSRETTTTSEEGTAEGLGYAQSEDTHALHSQEQIANPQAPLLERSQHDDSQAKSTRRDPTPYATQPAPSSDSHLLSPATSPTSPSFPPPSSSRERRPSLAPSASSVYSARSGASAATVASGGESSWEGASDIYDDYRYSRASMRPSLDAMSVRSGFGVMSNGGERRPSFDSIASGPGGHFSGMGIRRERMDSGASSSFSGKRLGGLVETMERDDRAPSKGEEELRVDEVDKDTEPHKNKDKGATNEQDRQKTLADVHTERLSRAHYRTSSVDSDASVYTQNSRLSTLSRDLAIGGVLAGLTSATSQGEDKDHRDSRNQSESPHGRTRPPPLALSASEPLLHTTWGSAVSSPTMSPPGMTAYTPVAGALTVEGRGMYSHNSAVSQRPAGMGVGSREDEEGGLKSPNTIAGFASSMRMRLEEDRLARAAEIQNDDSLTHESQYENTGLGSRIVIEDEDELPSRVANETYDSQADTTSSAYHIGDGDAKDSFMSADSRDTDSTAHNNLEIRTSSRVNTTASPSPEPEILDGLAFGSRLVVTNRTRTPSPSLLEGASDDGRLVAPDADETKADAATNPTSASSTAMVAAASSVVSPSISSQTPSSSSPAPSRPSHLRPSLAELREPTGAPLPGTNQRRSLFLPHPNAPKAPAGLVSPGPMYIAAQQQPPGAGGMLQGPHGPTSQRDQRPGGMGLMPYNPQNQQYHQPGAPRPGVLAIIHMALSRPPQPAGPARAPHQLRGPTIYGRTEAELGAALGPVPIVFSVEPPPLGTGSGSVRPTQGQGKGPQSGAPPTSPPRVQMMAKGGAPNSQAVLRSMSMGPGVAVPSMSGLNGAMNSNSMPSISKAKSIAHPGPGSADTSASSSLTVPGAGEQKAGPLPRANFFPKAAGLRPRSRSFSGFNSNSTEVPMPLQRSREDTEIPSSKEVHRSLTGRASSASLNSSRSQSSLVASSSSSSISASGNASSTQIKPGSSPLRPSPLSLSHLTDSGGLKPSSVSPMLKPPSSPLAQSAIVLPTSQSVSTPQSPEISLSPPPLNSGESGASASDTTNSRVTHHLGETPSHAKSNEALLRSPPSMHPKAFFDTAPSQTSSGPGRTASLQVNTARAGSLLVGGGATSPSSPHSMMDLATGEPRAEGSPPVSIARQTSLRSKLSLPNLRRKQSRQDDDPDAITSPTSLISVGPSMMHDPEMLQVKDMEFELVRPNLAHHFSQAARTSEDSAVLGRDGSFDLRQDNNAFLRPESPALSVSSGGGGAGSSMHLSGQRSPTIEGSWSSQTAVSAPVSPPPGASRPPTDSESSMDAHRQRELKWMALMAANPAASARKSKKVRKLVMEGVPSSVRYLVWSYLTDGKARCVPNVYAQLCARGKVGVADRIEDDIRRGFGDTDAGHEQLYSHLRGTQGPVGTLLSAYLNMVPDVQYSIGLTLIVGQLLLLAPEEDGFWTFVSIMDTHIRPYFSPSTTQMEVDAALFSRALENNDPQVARKLLVDMGILPAAICQPWFSTLFVGTLPPEYLNRVWDLFLFEGVPFLVRVALALMQCCRRRILESTSDESVLHVLRHPSPSLLPPTPDAFLALAFGVKHKDDDMRKQRVKMEAQVKRQTQVPRIASTSGISLPRT